MRRVFRQDLDEKYVQYLASRQKMVDDEKDLRSKVRRAVNLWDNKRKSKAGREAFSKIIRLLLRMCSGVNRCMYCEDSAGSQIEHIKPKAVYPEETFRWRNYLFACSVCNGFKHDKYCDDFMDPSGQDFDLWSRWRYDVATGHFRARMGDKGARETLAFLGFVPGERDDLADRRRISLKRKMSSINEYKKYRSRGEREEAQEEARSLCDDFSILAEWLLCRRFSAEEIPVPMRDKIERVCKIVDEYPEIIQEALGVRGLLGAH